MRYHLFKEERQILLKVSYRGYGLVMLLILLVVISIGYHQLFASILKDEKSILYALLDLLKKEPHLGFVIPCFFLFVIFISFEIKKALIGQRFRFEKDAQTFFSGKKSVALFSDIDFIEIKPIKEQESSETLFLLMALKDGSQKKLLESSDLEAMVRVGKTLSLFTGIRYREASDVPEDDVSYPQSKAAEVILDPRAERGLVPVWLHVALRLGLAFGGALFGLRLGSFLGDYFGLNEALSTLTGGLFFLAGFIFPPKWFSGRVAARCGKCAGRAWPRFDTPYFSYHCESCDHVTQTRIGPGET